MPTLVAMGALYDSAVAANESIVGDHCELSSPIPWPRKRKKIELLLTLHAGMQAEPA